MTPAMLEIRVIGELEVQLAGTKAELPASRRVRALLGWLAVHPGRHPRSRLAGQFWPDVLDASARASLPSAIWALRSALGPDFGSFLATDRDTVTLAADGLTVDLQEVRRLIEQGQPRAALDLCRGDLLQELDDDWVVEAREELDRDIAAALRDLMGQAVAAGDPAAAVVWARRRAALCPLDESAGADLISTLVQAGDASGALEALAKLRDRLGSELGVLGFAQTSAFVSQLRRTTGRLVEELQATGRLATPDTILIAGTAAAGPGQASPFAIWTDALSDLMSMTGNPPEDQTWTADLARIVPALAGGETGAGPARRAGADPQLDRVRLCEAVVQFVAWVSRQAPLLLAFEDLHLADTASLELIAYAGRRLSRLPVLLILPRRRLPARQDLDGVLGALRSRGALVAEVEVRPLADDAARALIRGSADLPAGAVEQIVTLAAGSPLLAVETARAAARDDTDLAAGLSGAARRPEERR